MAPVGKPSLKNYMKPRPVWMKVVGDTCVYGGTLVTTMGVATDSHLVAYISAGMTLAGFFFSNLYKAQVESDSSGIENEN